MNEKGARSPDRIKAPNHPSKDGTQASEAGDPGFKSPRARHFSGARQCPSNARAIALGKFGWIILLSNK
jgi:hypothetical protein